MGVMGELYFRIKRHLRYSEGEKKQVFAAIAVMSFVFGFNDNAKTFQLSHWAAHYLAVLFMVAVVFFTYDLTQKLMALKVGYRAEFKAWPTGLVISIVVALLSGGRWYVILPGGIMLYHMSILRLGKFRYGLNIGTQGWLSATGPLALLVLGTFFVALSKQLHFLPSFFGEFAKITFIFMIYQLLPIPKLNGLNIFFWSRMTYVFIFSTLLAYVVLQAAHVYSWVLSFIIGLICWILYYVLFEEKI